MGFDSDIGRFFAPIRPPSQYSTYRANGRVHGRLRAARLHCTPVTLTATPRASFARATLELERRLGPSKVLTGSEACATYASDDSDIEGLAPCAVVLGANAADVATALEIAERHDVPVTPRAGGTGRTGGAVPMAGGIVLATHALARIKDIDRGNLVAVVEPGVITGALHRAVEAEGLFYGPDPNSLESCMIWRQPRRERGWTARVQVRRDSRLGARPRGVPDGRARRSHRQAHREGSDGL